MTSFEKLAKLTECFAKEYEWGGALIVSINENRTCYQSIRDYLTSIIISGNPSSEINISEKEIADIEECEKSGNIYEISLYNFSPVGHYSVFGPTLEDASLEMLNIFKDCKDDVIINQRIFAESSK